MAESQRLAPELAQAVVDALASGLNPAAAGRVTGVSQAYCYRVRARLGRMRPVGTTYCERYLRREERYEIARLHDGGHSMREIARRVKRDVSTVSRELGRNSVEGSGYQPERAERLAWERQRRPKVSKLGADPVLRGEVQSMLDRRFSPEQISGRLPLLHPDNAAMRISPETIYQSIYVYPRGELRRELKASLRSGRAVRRRRGYGAGRGQILDAVSIHDRPEEVEGRLVPGHHEGDLIKGSTASNSAVGTLVERTTGFVNLLGLQDGYRAEQVADAVVEKMSELPAWFAKTLTWDRGHEMARHKNITAATGIAVYFADPYSPHQRGSNENTNGLLREYLPKGTDLSIYTDAELEAIADEVNDRPRKRLGFRTPREAFATLLAEHLHRVATDR